MKQETLLMAIQNNVGLKFIPTGDGMVRIVARARGNNKEEQHLVPIEVLQLSSNISGSVIDDTIRMLINNVKQ